MAMLDVQFPGDKKVDVLYKGFCIATDQNKPDGSVGEAPSPFDLF